MSEDAAEAIGSVADEAMRLVASMTTWAHDQASMREHVHEDGASAADTGESRSEAPRDTAASSAAYDDATGHPATDPSGAEQTGPGHAEGAVCGVCPFCRAAALLDRVSPETIHKAADLLGFAANALQDIAAHRSSAEGDPRPDARE